MVQRQISHSYQNDLAAGFSDTHSGTSLKEDTY